MSHLNRIEQHPDYFIGTKRIFTGFGSGSGRDRHVFHVILLIVLFVITRAALNYVTRLLLDLYI